MNHTYHSRHTLTTTGWKPRVRPLRTWRWWALEMALGLLGATAFLAFLAMLLGLMILAEAWIRSLPR